MFTSLPTRWVTTVLALIFVMFLAGLPIGTAAQTGPTPEPCKAGPTPTLIPAGATVAPTVYARQIVKDVSFVWVPAGCFLMGSDKSTDPLAIDDEQPQHAVCIMQGYWIGEFPITNAQFDVYVKAAGISHDMPEAYRQASSEPDQPVVGVVWDDAEGYATWFGARLPTEAEWEYAARGPQSPIYPWGNTFDSSKANTNEGHAGKTTRIGSYPAGASWVGAQDMAGNVWQWVTDWYSESYYQTQSSPSNDPTGPTSGKYRVQRGGSWGADSNFARAAYRGSLKPSYRGPNRGLRLILVGANPPCLSGH